MVHVRRNFGSAALVVSILGLLAILTARPSSAQYMFLDTNGDGLNTEGDRLPFSELPNEFTTVNIWLETDQNRDSSPASCPAGDPLTLRSYEICLRGEEVTFGTFTNLLPGFTGPILTLNSGLEYYTSFVGPELPPGKYHLATIRVRAGVSGLDIVESGLFSEMETAFGSACVGSGGVLRLGTDWFDTGGLTFGSINFYPTFGVPALDMVVPAGSIATQAIEATDPDGRMPLETTILSGPSYISLVRLERQSMFDLLRLHVAPGLADVGTASVTLETTDGEFSAFDQFTITVTPPVNLPSTVDFETPPLGDLVRQVIDPYTAPGVEFHALPSGTFQGAVGLIKNGATQCVDPSDTNQRLGTAPQGNPQIGGGTHPVEVVFSTPLQPPVQVSVEIKLGFTLYADLRLFDASGNEVAHARDITYERLPACSPLQFSGVRTLVAASTQPVAAARVQGPNGAVFTIDDFRFAQGVLTGHPIVAAPVSVTGSEGTLVSFEILALDPDGDVIDSLEPDLSRLPLGNDAALTKNATNTNGTFTWTPDFTHAGVYSVTFQVSNGGGSGSATTSIAIRNVNRVPVADAGGPYTGVAGVPVAFSGAGSSDSDGDALTYSWLFGDGSVGTGISVVHAYATSGTFTINLEVSDGRSFSERDVTTASITAFLDARAFLSKPNRSIALSSGSSAVCVQLEPMEGSYRNEDVDLTSVKMVSTGTGSVSEITAIADKTLIIGDTDQSGVEEISACFTRDALRQLFSNVNGRVIVRVVLEARLASGATVHGEVDLTVVGHGGSLTASVYPNPLNPDATITFVTTRAGAAKVRLFSASGRLVRTLMAEASLAAGYHDVRVDGANEKGSRLASGVYYYRVEAAEGSVGGRLAIVK